MDEDWDILCTSPFPPVSPVKAFQDSECFKKILFFEAGAQAPLPWFHQ